MIKILVSILLASSISFYSYAQSENTNAQTQPPTFDNKTFLEQCGGEIYPQCDSADLNQLTVYKAAEAVAKATGKSLFLIVGAEWCPPCHMVHEELTNNSEVRAQIEEKFVIVSISGDQRATGSTAQFFEYLNIAVRGFPTFFRVDPITNKATQLLVTEFKLENFKDALFSSDNLSRLEGLVAQIPELSGVPIEKLNVPLDLDEKFGQYPYYTSGFLGRETSSDKAINAGIARIHNFHYIDAVRAFKMAVNEDANNDLARSFLALAYVKFDPRFGGMFANLELKKVRRGRMKTEDAAWYDFIKSYVFSVTENLIDDTYSLSLDQALINLQLARPNDLEVLSLAQYFAKGTSDHSPFLAALSIDPNHLGANHYLIHLFEESSAYPQALDHAKKMAEIATDSSHAQHMLGHVLPRFQEWQQAKDQFNKAADIHKSWTEKYSFELTYDWHYSHNLDLMAITYVSFGQVDEAVEMFKSSCQSDSRGCESLLKLAAAEGRIQDIDWVRKYYLDAGADISRVDIYLLPYEIQAKLKSVLGAGSIVTEDYKNEILNQAMDFLKIPVESLQDSQSLIIRYMVYTYFGNKMIEDELREEFKVFEDEVVQGIYAFSEDRVGCSSFDGWGKGLLDTYQFYRLSQALDQKDLSERLKSILVNSLGIPLELN